MDKQQLLTLIEGKSDTEIKEILDKNFGITWDRFDRSCKSWYAKVFTYCNAEQLERELNYFLWLVNLFAPLFHVYFQEEETVFVGCSCHCGTKKLILYYSLTPLK
ncbi:hypothetical protein [Candidatus Galacturonibacter soehngenii]|nr:hypothetical protein [Candidatus Galacturonibacter soehngenii]